MLYKHTNNSSSCSTPNHRSLHGWTSALLECINCMVPYSMRVVTILCWFYPQSGYTNSHLIYPIRKKTCLHNQRIRELIVVGEKEKRSFVALRPKITIICPYCMINKEKMFLRKMYQCLVSWKLICYETKNKLIATSQTRHSFAKTLPGGMIN